MELLTKNKAYYYYITADIIRCIWLNTEGSYYYITAGIVWCIWLTLRALLLYNCRYNKVHLATIEGSYYYTTAGIVWCIWLTLRARITVVVIQ